MHLLYWEFGILWNLYDKYLKQEKTSLYYFIHSRNSIGYSEQISKEAKKRIAGYWLTNIKKKTNVKTISCSLKDYDNQFRMLLSLSSKNRINWGYFI